MPTILVVEDEPAIRELIAIHLNHADFQVQLAERADIAETAVQQMLPDAVILDWMLPDGSGIALAKKFRANERTRNLPIIMLTAARMKTTRFQVWKLAPTITLPSRFRRKNW